MQPNRVSGLQNRVVSDLGTGDQNIKRRKDLHQSSGFEQSAGRHDLSALNPEKQRAASEALKAVTDAKPRFEQHRFPDGTTVQLPRLSIAHEQAMERVFGRLSPEKRAELDRRLVHLGGKALDEAGTTSASAGLQNYANDTFGSDLMRESQKNEDGKSEITASVLYAVEKNIYEYFLGVREKQEITSDVRTDISELNEMLADWPEGETQSFTYNDVTIGDDGAVSVKQVTVELDKEQAQALAQKLENTVTGMGDISGMEQFQLQKMVQDYQQAVTTLSNIIKHQDESLRGVIQNVRA